MSSICKLLLVDNSCVCAVIIEAHPLQFKHYGNICPNWNNLERKWRRQSCRFHTLRQKFFDGAKFCASWEKEWVWHALDLCSTVEAFRIHRKILWTRHSSFRYRNLQWVCITRNLIILAVTETFSIGELWKLKNVGLFCNYLLTQMS